MRGRLKMEKYRQLAKDLEMVDAKIISAQDIFFDIRAILKCRWGCENFFQNNIRCSTRKTSFQERVEMVKRYNHILLVHAHNAVRISRAVLEIERAAFLDGCHFAFAIRTCNLCENCAVQHGSPCPMPEKVRPCDQSFGIDVYRTVRTLGLPCDVLQNQTDVQNRYGFVLLD